MATTKTYYVNSTDNTKKIVIQPNTYNGPGGILQDSDLYLHGNALLNWGENVNEDVYRITENFAINQKESHDPGYSAIRVSPKDKNSTAQGGNSGDPVFGIEFGINEPTKGQLWFNKSDSKIYVYTQNTEWKCTGAGTSKPAVPTTGDLAYTGGLLQVYNGSSWDNIAIDLGGPSAFVLKAGDTMTGPLTVPSDLTIKAKDGNYNGGRILLKSSTNVLYNDCAVGLYEDNFRVFDATKTGIIPILDYSYRTGDLFLIKQGQVHVVNDPTADDHLANKRYVDGITSGSGFPSGTTMLFAQASAPTGWTLITSQDNKMLRVVNGTGGGSGGSDDPTVMNKVPAHTHVMSGSTLSQGAHTHTTAMFAHPSLHTAAWSGGGHIPGFGGVVVRTGSEGAHTHTISATIQANTGASNWEPKYYDVIFARKD